MCFCRSNMLWLVLFPSRAFWTCLVVGNNGKRHVLHLTVSHIIGNVWLWSLGWPISPALSTCRVKSVSHAALLCSQILFIIHLKATTFLFIHRHRHLLNSFSLGFGRKKSSFCVKRDTFNPNVNERLKWCLWTEGTGNEEILIRLLSNYSIRYANNFMHQTPETYLGSKAIEAFVPWVYRTS